MMFITKFMFSVGKFSSRYTSRLLNYFSARTMFLTQRKCAAHINQAKHFYANFCHS